VRSAFKRADPGSRENKVKRLILTVLAIVFCANLAIAAPISFTRNPVIASENKELMSGIAEALKKTDRETVYSLVEGMVVLRELKVLPKGITLKCVFDCGDVCLAKIIDTSYEYVELIGQEFWFLTASLEPNNA